MSEPIAEQQTQPRKKNRGWIWYLLLLLALTALAVAAMILFNLSQQLTTDQLETALQKWQQHRPESYELHYLVKRTGADKADSYRVRVLGDEVVSVTLNDLPLKFERLKNHSMTALLNDIKTFMDRDAEPGKPWTFTKAMFDEDDGHLRWYVRRVMGSRERVEIEVREFKPLEESGS